MTKAAECFTDLGGEANTDALEVSAAGTVERSMALFNPTSVSPTLALDCSHHG